MTDPRATHIRYTFSVYIECALDEDGEPCVTGRESEKQLYKALTAKFHNIRPDGDVDLELMETEYLAKVVR